MSKRSLYLILPLFVLIGCARFGSAPESEMTPTPTYEAVPTFTPTAVVAKEATAAPTQSQDSVPSDGADSQSAAQGADVAESSESAAAETGQAENSLLPTPTPNAPTSDGAPTVDEAGDAESVAVEDGPRLVVVGELVNVRQGPGTGYPTVGAAAAAESFKVTGRNEAGDWWQVCCFEEAPGWLYGPLVDVQAGDVVAVAADIPPAPTATPVPEPVVESVVEEPVQAEVAEPPAEEVAPVVDSGTAGNFDPEAQYHVVGYRVLGYGENNGGLFNNGAQHMIFVNVIDANGAGVDGAVVKNAINDNINIVTGPKGPGRAEFEMFWDPYKLYVASDPSGPVTSQITNQMNTAYPHIADIVGRLGPAEEEYAICPTLDDRCEPPFYHAHWSYEVTFQKVK